MPESVTKAAQSGSAGYAAYGEVTAAASYGSSGFSTQDSAPTRKRFILIGVDGFQYNHYVTMLNTGNLTNFTRLLQRAGFNTTHNITGHTNSVTAAGWAEIHTGLNSGLTGVTDNTCSNPVPNGNTTFERLEQFNSSIVTGVISGKSTCYVPDGVLGNAITDINHFFNRSNYTNTGWTDGTACAFDRNVSTKAQEFIVNFTNESFYLFAYFGTPDCSGHVGTDNSNNYNDSFVEVNHALGILLDTLRDQSIENTTAVVIIADHGWNEGTTGHSTFNSDTAIIPLITNNRSIINNASTDGSREQCDVAPTILDYFGMPAANYSDILNNNCSSMFDRSYSINAGGSACAVINTSYFLIGNVLSNTSCFVLNASNITFDCAGFSITGNATGDGIAVTDNRVNVTIKDCVVRNFDRGIRFTNVNNSVIQNSSGLNATTDGISLGSSHFNLIANSTGTGSGGAGIRLETSTFNNLTNVSGNGESASGVLIDSSTNTTVRDSRANSTSGTAAWYVFAAGTSQILNTTGVSENGNGIRIDSGGAVLVANSTGRSSISTGILTTSADYTRLIDSTGASNTSTGISLGTNVNATNVTGLSNTSQGIIFSSASDAVLRNSRASSNSSSGLFFSSATGSTAINVTATSATATAITIGSGTANRVINSTATSTSSNALLIEFSTFNNLTGNTFSNSNIGVLFTGAVAGSAAINNTITGGVISGNVIGIGVNGFAEDNRFENLTLSSNTRAGIQLNDSTFQNIVRNVTFAGNLFGILFAGGNNNTIVNSTVNGTRAAINVTNNGFNNSLSNTQLELNATFEFSNNITGPTVLIFPQRLNFTASVRLSNVLNVSNNRIFVNGSTVALNHTAHIIMHNTFIEPNVTYDPEDDGTFGACPASICTMLSQSSGRIHFSVSGFTAFGSNETGPLNISNTTVVSNATFNGSRNNTLSGLIGDAFGFAVGAGDFNNDTVKDHVFGAPFVPDNLAITATGKVYVVYGQTPFTPGMNVTEVTANITIRGPTNNGSAQLGRAVAAGDLNGDLIDDLVYALPGIHQVGVLFGAHGLGTVRPRFNETNISINTSSLIDIGLAVADFNNDSIADLAIGQPDFSIFDNETNATFQGRVDVLYGRASWPSFVNLSQNANVTLTGTVAGDRFGFAVAAGDVNGDGIKDLIAGAPRRNVSGIAGVGVAYVFFGGATFLSAPALAANAIMEGEAFAFGASQANASTGFALFANGDVNNDSVADILIGAPNLAVDSPLEYDAGATYVVFGRSSLAGTFNLSAANVTMYGTFGSASPGGIPGGERSGFALFARDVTNDSTDDVFIGAPMADTSGVADAGIVYLVYGLQSWPRFLNLTQANRSFADLVQNSSFGWSLANGSVLVGAPDLDAQRSPVSGLFEATSGNAFPGLSIGHAYDIGSPGIPDITTTVTTTTSTTTTTLPSSSGGGGGSTGGGSRGVYYSCRPNQDGEPGAQFFGVEAGLGKWRNCDEEQFWTVFGAGNTYLSEKIGEAYSSCCECTTRKRCDPGQKLVVEEVPKPPCRGTIREFLCGKSVGSITPSAGFPYKGEELQKELDECCAQTGCVEELTCLPCHGGPLQDGVCLHLKHPHGGDDGGCSNQHITWYCDQDTWDFPTGVGTTFGQILGKKDECCKKPEPEIPAFRLCPLDPFKTTTKVCNYKNPLTKDGARIEETTKEFFVRDPPCEHVLWRTSIAWKPCPTPPAIPNRCWKRGKATCNPATNSCDIAPNTCPGNADCCNVGPDANAPNACAMWLFNGPPAPALFTYDGRCDKDCNLQCWLCDDFPLLQMFQNMIGGWMTTGSVSGVPPPTPLLGGLVKCFKDELPKPPEVPLWPPIPEKPPFPTPTPTPTPTPEPTPVVPTETRVIDHPGPITQITTSPPPAPQPQVAVEVVDQTQIICAATGSPSDNSRVTRGGEVDADALPAGYEVITTFSASCPAGRDVSVTVNVPDQFTGIRAFLQTPAGTEPVPAQEQQEASCGGADISGIRSQQIGESRGDYYALEEMPTFVQQQAILAPGQSAMLQAEGYAVELQGVVGATRATLSMPRADVPYPANPSARILGTPLLVTFDQPVTGAVKITFPVIVPQHVDASSIGIYALLGDSWRQLENVEVANGKASVVVDDIGLFLNANNEALFALVGIYCASCPGTKLEKVYDGGALNGRHAVVLVHGITTDSLRWQSLVDDFVLTKQPFQVWMFSYPLGLPPDEIGAQLAAELETHAAEFDTVHFITHSMGGIETQLALDVAARNNYQFVRKVGNAVFAGQPGLGSPAAEVYGRLFAFLLNLKSTAMLFAQDSPMLRQAVDGRQVPRTPGVEYFIIAGRQPYTFTKELFGTGVAYKPNDGVISIFSARTVGGKEITDTCEHYFEVPLTHTDLIDAWLPRRIMGRIVARDLAEQQPDRAIIGYNKVVSIGAQCVPGTYVVVGKRIAEAATADPMNCKCGNGVCGEGENELNCPNDCSRYYQYFYLCRIAPWILYPLAFILLLVTAGYAYRAVAKHQRTRTGDLLLVATLLLLGACAFLQLVCGKAPLLAYVVLLFVASLLLFAQGHLRQHREYFDDSSAQKLEELLEKARPK